MASSSWRPFSTRALLLYSLTFNFVVVVLAEKQRGALVYRIEELIQRQDERRKDEARQLPAVQVLTKNGRFASNQEIQAAIVGKLYEGNQITVRFDNSDLESRDSSGSILCGPKTVDGYLGVFIAGAEYKVNYDRHTHQWITSGPVQSQPRDPLTSTCGGETSGYGPKESGAVISPQEAIVLWGASFKLRGLDVYLSDQKVGQIVATG